MDEEREIRANQLKSMMESPGGVILFKHIEEEMKDGWDEFIGLPVAQKTSKAAFNYQARYEVLTNLKAWIESEIKLGDNFRNSKEPG